MRRHRRTKKGFTLVELLVAAAITLVVAGGFFYLLVLSFELNETSRNLTYALHGAETKLEEMLSENPATEVEIFNEYDHSVTGDFTNSLPANMTGRVYVVTNSSPYLVTVAVSWTQRGDRLIGDLDNTNSPAKIVTLMTNRLKPE